jgi:NADH dehydrogenase/NADH:ubiquinone oxidoreductase subunit G
MANITLDGARHEVPETLTVLEAARLAGIEIPTLCHHEALGPYGACRLCVVEVEGPALRRSLTTACTLPVSSGLVVESNSPAVQQARKIVLELLLGRSPNSATLRALALSYGVHATRFGSGRHDDTCVRCGLCVRACRDKIGTAAISFAGRGQQRQVTTQFGELSELCIGCGACAAICPTGTICLQDREQERVVVRQEFVVAQCVLLRCASCGAAFGTQKLRDRVAAHLREQMHGTTGATCPKCRRMAHLAMMDWPRPPAYGPLPSRR